MNTDTMMTINGRAFEVRPLTRKQIREVKAKGFDIYRAIQALADCKDQVAAIGDGMDAVLDVAFPQAKEALDGAEFREANELYQRVFFATIKAPAETKNS